MKSIDPRMAFGFYLVTIMFIMAVAIALGKVHQDTSFGLDRILDGLKVITAFWAGWAFDKGKNPPVD